MMSSIPPVACSNCGLIKCVCPQIEQVDHPKHYNSHPSGVECITIIEHYNLNLGNVIKYVWRAGLKGGLLVDLKKAQWYLNREIARLEKEQNGRNQ